MRRSAGIGPHKYKLGDSFHFVDLQSGPVVAPNRIGPYSFKDALGHGGYSVVRQAIDDRTGEIYACKIIPKKRLMMQNSEERFELEVRILEKLSHPGVVKLVDLYKDTINFYLIMELIPYGSLMQFMCTTGKIPQDKAKTIFKGIVETLDYIHNNNIAHRDIKPDNILLDPSTLHIKFIDFGLSHKGQEGQDMSKTKCGSLSYMSPECLQGNIYDGFKSDIWSLGVSLYMMLFGATPWTKNNEGALVRQIVNGEFFVSPSVGPDAQDLINRMMTVNPYERITLREILDHPWLKGVELEKQEMVVGSKMEGKIEQFFGASDPTNPEEMREQLKDVLLKAKARRRMVIQPKVRSSSITNMPMMRI